MGIDKFRFIGSISEYLLTYFLCPVCDDVVEEPIVSPCCQSIFCRKCYYASIADSFTGTSICQECNLDVQELIVDCDFRGTLRKVYEELSMRCKHQLCREILSVENYKEHDSLCGWRIKSKKAVDHDCNCSPELTSLIRRLERIENAHLHISLHSTNESNREPRTGRISLWIGCTTMLILFFLYSLFVFLVNFYDEDWILPPQ